MVRVDPSGNKGPNVDDGDEEPPEDSIKSKNIDPFIRIILEVVEWFTRLVDDEGQREAHEQKDEMEDDPLVARHITVIFIFPTSVQGQDLIQRRFLGPNFVTAGCENPQQAHNYENQLDDVESVVRFGERAAQVVGNHIGVEHEEPIHQQGVAFHHTNHTDDEKDCQLDWAYYCNVLCVCGLAVMDEAQDVDNHCAHHTEQGDQCLQNLDFWIVLSHFF